MLNHLLVQNFVIMEKVEVEIKPGLSVITGETGAGKSIIIDALSVLLGARSDNTMVGQFGDRCDLVASFDVRNIPKAVQWLKFNDLLEGNHTECVIRRVLHKDGKSRQLINGYPCTLQQLKNLAQLIVNIHSQNGHLLLLKSSHQRELLDSYGNHLQLLNEVAASYQEWQTTKRQLEDLQKDHASNTNQKELLDYQIAEFDKFNLLPDEYEQLDQEQKQLANAESLLKNCQEALSALSDEENSARDSLYFATKQLQPITNFHLQLQSVQDLIGNALLHLDEAAAELRGILSSLEINPERLAVVERRLSKIHELARKYQVQPQDLMAVYERLSEQQTNLKDMNEQIEVLEEQLVATKESYTSRARELHEARTQTAIQLNKVITESLQRLGMPGGGFEVTVNWREEELTTHGSDHIEFMVATNPGHPAQPLSKVASGGEISRIALAIYVATAEQNTTPLLIFDEVDVGIGGPTAAIVGDLLKSLGKKAQVLCITHLPQVAAYGQHHLLVYKEVKNETTVSDIKELTQEERIQELARMLGGVTITKKTLAHAKELLT